MFFMDRRRQQDLARSLGVEDSKLDAKIRLWLVLSLPVVLLAVAIIERWHAAR